MLRPFVEGFNKVGWNVCKGILDSKAFVSILETTLSTIWTFYPLEDLGAVFLPADWMCRFALSTL